MNDQNITDEYVTDSDVERMADDLVVKTATPEIATKPTSKALVVGWCTVTRLLQRCPIGIFLIIYTSYHLVDNAVPNPHPSQFQSGEPPAPRAE